MGVSVAGLAVRDGQILVVRRLPGGSLGGKWELPGGKVEAGETHEAALVREWREELDLSVEVGEQLGQAAFVHKGEEFRLYGYRVFPAGHEPVLREHDHYRWVSPVDMTKLDMAGSDVSLLSSLGSIL